MTTQPTLQQLRNTATAHGKHARQCKKPIDGCSTCQATVAWFRQLPAPVLALVLEDKGKPVRG